MSDLCTFPLCKYPVVQDGFCLRHAKYFAGPKPEKPKKKIAQYSKKRIKKNKELKSIVDELKLVNPGCQIHSPVCTGKAQGSNHLQKRSPYNLTEINNLELACNACNSYCEQFPNWAKENGHSISRFKKVV